MSDRAKELDEYIKGITPNELSEWGTKRIELKGRPVKLQIYRIPIQKLIFRIENGRFAAELKAKEAELKRRLDTTKLEDAKIIQKLLLNLNENETAALKSSLIKDGQLEPGVITFDGAVVDANRRMAILIDIFEETRQDRFQYLEVGRLPQNVDEKDLWKIEAGLQFAKEYKLGYGPINELLKLSEGVRQGLAPEDISQALLGRFSKNQITNKLEVLSLIKLYLKLVGTPEQYHLVRDQQIMEKFIALQGDVVSWRGKGLSAEEQYQFLRFAFSMIAKTEKLFYGDIRYLKSIADHKDVVQELLKGYNSRAPTEITENEVLDLYKSAVEVIENREERDRPEGLIKKAISAIEPIEETNPKLKEPHVITLLQKLETKARKLRGGK